MNETTPKNNNKKKKLIKVYIIEALLLFVLCLALIITISSSHKNKTVASSGTEATQSVSEEADVITAKGGALQVNKVIVKVPENADYDITYGWTSSDTDYPTKPLIATASYSDKNETPLYELSLYKDSFFSNTEVPKGKTVTNWYNDWEIVEEEKCTQEPHQVKELQGFLITSVNDSAPLFHTSNYSTTSSFYFVIKTEKGIEQYIFEGTCHEESSAEEFHKIMQECLDSITLNEKSNRG